MVRDLLGSLAAAVALWGSSFTFAYLCQPEPAELKLARIRAGLDWSMPLRTLPPEVKAIRCMVVWVGTAGPELWCPAVPPRPEQVLPAIPTS